MVGGETSNIFYFHPYIVGEMIQFDYFSDGLVQPPTR